MDGSKPDKLLMIVVLLVLVVAWALFSSFKSRTQHKRRMVEEKPAKSWAEQTAALRDEVSKLSDDDLHRITKHQAHAIRRQQVAQFLEFYRNHRLSNIELADVKLLPFPKEEIIESLTEVFVATTNEHLRAQLFEVAHELPQYREGIGGRRLTIPRVPAQSERGTPLTEADFLAVLPDRSDAARQIAQHFVQAEVERIALRRKLMQLIWQAQSLTDEWRVATFGKCD